MSLFDLGAALFVQRRHDEIRRRQEHDKQMERIEYLMEAVGEKIADEIRNPNPWKYVGDGAWVDMTITRQGDLELRA